MKTTKKNSILSELKNILMSIYEVLFIQSRYEKKE